MKKGTLKDPDCITSDVSMTGHWGNGDYRLYISDKSQIKDVMKLVNQSFDANSK